MPGSGCTVCCWVACGALESGRHPAARTVRVFTTSGTSADMLRQALESSCPALAFASPSSSCFSFSSASPCGPRRASRAPPSATAISSSSPASTLTSALTCVGGPTWSAPPASSPALMSTWSGSRMPTQRTRSTARPIRTWRMPQGSWGVREAAALCVARLPACLLAGLLACLQACIRAVVHACETAPCDPRHLGFTAAGRISVSILAQAIVAQAFEVVGQAVSSAVPH